MVDNILCSELNCLVRKTKGIILLLGQNIKQIREFQGLNQAGLAVKTGLSKSAIHNLETGNTKEPKYSTVVAVANALGVTPDLLYADALTMTYTIQKAG